MKKFIFFIATILSLTLASCSNENSKVNLNNNSSDSIVRLDEGVCPENKYTEGLPVPPGTVSWAILDKTKEYCGINLVDLTNDEYNTYMELLKQNDFSLVEEVSENVEGQDYTSTGTVLSNGEKTLSISYIPDNLGIYISFDTKQDA
jgi:hypothetical protein